MTQEYLSTPAWKRKKKEPLRRRWWLLGLGVGVAAAAFVVIAVFFS